LLSPGLLLLLPFAEHKVITSDSTTNNMVESGIFISIPWFYLATLIEVSSASVFKGRQQEDVSFPSFFFLFRGDV